VTDFGHSARVPEQGGGTILPGRVKDFDLSAVCPYGAICGIETNPRPRWPGDDVRACHRASGQNRLMAKLGAKCPAETERGYHVIFEGRDGRANCAPVMIAV